MALTSINLNGIMQLDLNFDGTTTAAVTSPGVIQINNTSPSSGYSLGGALTIDNLVLGPGAGSSATYNIVGLDGNHQIQVIVGSSPASGSNLFTVTFTESRGHTTYPVLDYLGFPYSGFNQIPFVLTFTDTGYTVSTNSVALTSGNSYTWHVSCP